MSELDRPTSGHCGEDVAAFALGALSEQEAQAFRAHLTTCPVCPDELAAFGAAVELLAVSAPPRHASRRLKRRVMRDVANEPRLDAMAQQRRQRQLRFGRPAFAFGGAATALAAIIAALVLVLGGSGNGNRVIDAVVTGHGQATLRLSGNQGQLVLDRFPAAPKDEIYEVWTEHGSGSIQPTTALFGVNRSGAANVTVPGSLQGVSHVLVTVEPAGGTKVPTHTPVIDAALG